ncbi:LysR family transcriptional regulator [Actinoallomurus bryophytorum]|uniref:Molybdate transport repressor ModE-like protein n=1 Tax=Actinoallomurus bryophytorum TaxID=1490222 RepID=A0A543CN56_9ACTN|nr:LysR family transcriptional regulator [Actinoallomurus bryophytorum]TQL98534.1 molybdate transport repressor ModE-like protein [Actinoallomurus bryophytorum]
MLDVSRLRVLVAIARTGSVTAAAKELHYSQPSVSHHLARLEAETGAQLVRRAGRGIRLTEAGRTLAERGAEILGRLDAAEAELSAHVGLSQGRVRLAAFPSALGTFVPRAAALLAARHPGLQVSLSEAEPPEAVRMLRAGYVDVAVIFRYDLEGEDDGITTRRLLDEPSYLVTASEALETSPDLAAFSDAEWIAGCDRCRLHLLDMCSRAGFDPKISFTTDDFVAVQAMVAAGLGVTTLPGLALAAARNPSVHSVVLPGSTRYVLAATYGAPPEPPATSALLDALATPGTAMGDP